MVDSQHRLTPNDTSHVRCNTTYTLYTKPVALTLSIFSFVYPLKKIHKTRRVSVSRALTRYEIFLCFFITKQICILFYVLFFVD